MRRLPLLPSLIVAAAVATMIGLGVWQLGRADEKATMLAQYARAAALPALDLDPLLDRRQADLPPLAFRRVLVSCHARGVEPELRGGRSRGGRSGYSWFVPCRPGEAGWGGRLVVNAGWSALPQQGRQLTLDGPVAGTLGAVREEGRIVVTAAAAAPRLEPSAPPRLDDIPNNHLAYAFQWFFFAAAALVIYVLALRRRLSRAP